MIKMVQSAMRQRFTQERIDAQQLLVASLRPGTEEHRLSVKVLLLLQDALHLLIEAEALLAAAGSKRSTA